MTWYAQSGRRSKDTGKFRSRSRVAKAASEEYRGWSFSFVSHETGASVRRTCVSVSIKDTNGHQAAYLRDFSSVEQAKSAAHEWIDRVCRRTLPVATPGEVGSIPALPASPIAQEK